MLICLSCSVDCNVGRDMSLIVPSIEYFHLQQQDNELSISRLFFLRRCLLRRARIASLQALEHFHSDGYTGGNSFPCAVVWLLSISIAAHIREVLSSYSWLLFNSWSGVVREGL